MDMKTNYRNLPARNAPKSNPIPGRVGLHATTEGGNYHQHTKLPLLVFVLAFVSAQLAWAGGEPTPFRTGLFGVGAGQAVRISIVNGNERGIIAPCVRVRDADGRLLSEWDSGPVLPGVGTFVDFVPDGGVPATAASRLQLRAEVELLPAVTPAGALRRLQRRVLPSLEVFDTATGSTVFTLPFAEVAGINPQPFAEVAGIDPTPFRTGLFGVTPGQSVRVSILNDGQAGSVINPCVRIWDAAGTLLFETHTGPLPSGVGAFADFEPAPEGDTPPTGGPPRGNASRVQLRAEVDADHPADGSNRGARRHFRGRVLLTLEVFDTATGRTIYTMPFSAVAGIDPQPF
jgi:hypothetical protein